MLSTITSFFYRLEKEIIEGSYERKKNIYNNYLFYKPGDPSPHPPHVVRDSSKRFLLRTTRFTNLHKTARLTDLHSSEVCAIAIEEVAIV